MDVIKACVSISSNSIVIVIVVVVVVVVVVTCRRNCELSQEHDEQTHQRQLKKK